MLTSVVASDNCEHPVQVGKVCLASFDRAGGGGGQGWNEISLLPGEVVRRGVFLGKARQAIINHVNESVCVCVT